jgi:hypothetical protein
MDRRARAAGTTVLYYVTLTPHLTVHTMNSYSSAICCCTLTYIWASEASFKATSPAALSQVSTVSFFFSMVPSYLCKKNARLHLLIPYHAFEGLDVNSLPSFRLFTRFPKPAMAVHPHWKQPRRALQSWNQKVHQLVAH